MNAYDTAAGTAQDDWLAGLMVSEEPKPVAVPAQPPAIPAAPASMPAPTPEPIPSPFAIETPAPPPVPVQVLAVQTVAPAPVAAPAPPPVPVMPPPAPAAGENWLAMVMPEAAAAGVRTPINPGPSLKERLKLAEKSKRIGMLLTGAAKRMLPLCRRQFMLPFVLGAATMYGGEMTVRYFFPPKTPDQVPQVDPKPNPSVKPDQQVIVKPKPETTPVNPTPSVNPNPSSQTTPTNNVANNNTPNNQTPANNIPANEVPNQTLVPPENSALTILNTQPSRPSPWTTPPATQPALPNFDWVLPPVHSSLQPIENPLPNPWRVPNDFESLFNPKPRQ